MGSSNVNDREMTIHVNHDSAVLNAASAYVGESEDRDKINRMETIRNEIEGSRKLSVFCF